MKKIVFPAYPIGYRYGSRTVISDIKKRSHTYGYDVQCDCGYISFISRNIIFENTRAKACYKCANKKESSNEITTIKPVIIRNRKPRATYPDYPVGYVYGNRTIVSEKKLKGFQWGYDATCECGNITFLRRHVIYNKSSAQNCIKCYREKIYKNMELFSHAPKDTMKWHRIDEEKPLKGSHCLFSEKYLTAFRILPFDDRFDRKDFSCLMYTSGESSEEEVYWWAYLKDIKLSDNQKKQLDIENRYNDLQNKLNEIQKEMRAIKPDGV